jgi:AGZA family xanthine/uracil permease-like MFS transporter
MIAFWSRRLAERQTTLPREAVAGLTTFMASAYLVVVIPRLLSGGGWIRRRRPRPPCW